MFDRRIVGLVALSIALAGSISLSVLAWRGVMTPALLLVSCFIIGSGMALFGPAWQASVSEQVPAEALPSAVALNGISYNIARSFGPAIGGVIVASAGPVAAFITNALLYLQRWLVMRSATASRRRAGAFAPGSPATQKDVRSASQPRSPSASKPVLNSPIEYRERGRTKVATYRELSLKMLVDRAISGDLSAAELALKIVTRAERYGDPGVDPILIEDWIADYPDQTANQKTADFAAGRDAKPAEWWRSSED